MEIEAGDHQSRLTTDPGWRDRAACRGLNPDLFFPVGMTGPAVQQIEDALAICRRCDVQTACLDYALNSNQDTGIWGGTTERERKNLRRTWVGMGRPAVADIDNIL